MILGWYGTDWRALGGLGIVVFRPVAVGARTCGLVRKDRFQRLSLLACHRARIGAAAALELKVFAYGFV
jgi:hypothetical protein